MSCCVPLVCVAVLHAASAVADDERPSSAPPRSWERVSIRGDDGARTISGVVVAEVADGGLLVELPDQRYEPLPPDVIVSRESFPAPAAESPRDLGRRVLAELPPGFDVHVTRHYVICFNTSRDYAKWAGGLFERLYDAFLGSWRRAGLNVHEPDRPLIVVIFSDRRDYQARATRDVGSGAERVSGYYSFLTNRVTTYDLTAADGLTPPSGRGPGRLGLEILAQPEAEGLVATLVHEATHQMAFNSGMHRRLAPVPLWVCEGVATYFETPDLRSQSGWRGIGALNASRLGRFRQTYQAGDLERIIGADDAFREPEAAGDAYAKAWALTWFLMTARRDAFVKYLAALADKQPGTEYDRANRLRDFEAAFGAPKDLEPAFLRHMQRVQMRAP